MGPRRSELDAICPKRLLKDGILLDAGGSSTLRRICFAYSASRSPIRQIFKEAFAAAGLPYFNPHTFSKDIGASGRPNLQGTISKNCWRARRNKTANAYIIEIAL